MALRKSPCGPLWRGGRVPCCAGRGPENLADPPLPPTPLCPRPSGRGVFPVVLGAEEHDFLVAAPGDPPDLLRCPQPQRVRRLAVRAHLQERFSWGRPPAPCNDFLFVVGGRRAWGLRGFTWGSRRARARARGSLGRFKGVIRRVFGGFRPRKPFPSGVVALGNLSVFFFGSLELLKFRLDWCQET